jgi:hypothetical protein
MLLTAVLSFRHLARRRRMHLLDVRPWILAAAATGSPAIPMEVIGLPPVTAMPADPGAGAVRFPGVARRRP